MNNLVKLATCSACCSTALHKHGCVLICNGQTFTGFNHHQTSRINAATIHAEEHALNNCINWFRRRCYTDSYIRRKLRQATIFTIRVHNGAIKHSDPCAACVVLIRRYCIKNVSFSNLTDDGTVGFIDTKPRFLTEMRASSGNRWIQGKQA